MGKIMIVEDDADIRIGIRIILESQGYQVDEAENGEKACSKFDNSYQLIILDIKMPGMSGIEVCQKIRKISYIPIMFLTAKSSDIDKMNGLIAGGDDYMIKPFSYVEFIARVKALLRRCNEYNGKTPVNINFADIKRKEEWLNYGKLKVSMNKNSVFISEQEIKLTETEYQILLLFVRYPNKIYSVDNIFESVWNEPYIYSSSNTVMVHIKNLRAKLEKQKDSGVKIKTVWGKGYRLEV